LKLPLEIRASLQAAAQVQVAPQPPAGILPRWSLPQEPATFVGRQAEIETALQILRGPGSCRLVLIGPPGIGKTRLAIEIATRLHEYIDDRIAFVPLGSMATAEQAMHNITMAAEAVAARARAPHKAAPSAGLPRALLVIDRAGSMPAAVGATVSQFSRHTSLSMILTTQIQLPVQNCAELHVGPLPTPPPEGPLEPSELGKIDSVVLFTHGMRRANPEFRLTRDNAEAVATLCREVDGHPLSIRWAAGQLSSLSTSASPIWKLIEQLRSKARGDQIPRELATPTLELSYASLDAEARTLLENLSVFNGPFDIGEAKAVAGLPEGTSMQAMKRLVNHSLMVELADGRFWIFYVVRAYAGARLHDSPRNHQTRYLHAQHFTELAEDMEPHLTGRSMGNALAALELRRSEFLVALAWCFDSGEVRLGARLAVTLRRFWQLRGYVAEGQGWVERALASLPEPDAYRLAALAAAASLAYCHGDDGRWEQLATELADLGCKLDDPEAEQTGVLSLCWIAAERGEHNRARDLLKRHVPRGSPRQRTVAHLRHLQVEADLARLDGRDEECQVLLRRVASEASKHHAYHIASVAHLRLGISLVENQRFTDAKQEFIRLLTGYLQHKDRQFVPHALEGIAASEAEMNGVSDRTSILLASAERLRTSYGCPRRVDMRSILQARKSLQGVARHHHREPRVHECRRGGQLRFGGRLRGRRYDGAFIPISKTGEIRPRRHSPTRTGWPASEARW